MKTGRPQNNIRREAMYRALDVAGEQLTHSIGDLEHLALENKRIAELANPDEQHAQSIDWTDDYWEAKRPLEMREIFDLAARLFNRSLKRAQEQGERENERETTAKAIEQAYYRRTSE